MKIMWMIIFLLLPLLGIAYIAWHVWCLLPCAWWWKVLAIALLAGSFLTMMFGMRGLYDSMPLSVGTALYEIGTSSIFVMMYLVILFLVLDIARLCLWKPPTWQHPLLCQQRIRHLGWQIPRRHPLRVHRGKGEN